MKCHSTIQDRNEILVEKALERLDELLSLLEIDLNEGNSRFFGKCPIHDGYKNSSLNLYKDTGIWQCFTNNCHKEWGSSLLYFIRAILSKKNNGKIVSYEESARFLSNFLNLSIDDLQVNEYDVEKKRFIRSEGKIRRKLSSPRIESRSLIRSKLIIPAEYYIDKGFSTKILNEYDIGLCLNKNKLFYNRIIFPIYDINDKFVGASARSIFGKCHKCNFYHDQQKKCPPENSIYGSKWLHTKGLRKTEHLYNLRRCIGSECIILVEGVTDCLRLVDAGFPNTVALFGIDMSYLQLELLCSTSATQIITILDNDEAGNKGRKNIDEKCQNLYYIKHLVPSTKDVGEMSTMEIQSWLSNKF